MARDDQDAADDASSAPMSRWAQFTGTVSNFMMKSPKSVSDDDTPTKVRNSTPETVPEIEAAIKRADDKERLVGLLAAPIAAAISLLVVGALLAHDPKALYGNGHIDRLHVSPNLYVELGAVAMALALTMLIAAWFRKRLVIGIAMALYGLSIFNLHYWGFGLPFILGGAWYLVRAYRLSEKLKFVKAGGSTGGAATGGPSSARPQPSKRYTPPAAPIRRAPKPKPGKELEAG
jgi:hypothetical protein